MKVSIDNFRDSRRSLSRMAKGSSPQIFPIDLFMKEAYHVVKILHKYNGLRTNNMLLI